MRSAGTHRGRRSIDTGRAVPVWTSSLGEGPCAGPEPPGRCRRPVTFRCAVPAGSTDLPACARPDLRARSDRGRPGRVLGLRREETVCQTRWARRRPSRGRAARGSTRPGRLTRWHPAGLPAPGNLRNSNLNTCAATALHRSPSGPLSCPASHSRGLRGAPAHAARPTALRPRPPGRRSAPPHATWQRRRFALIPLAAEGRRPRRLAATALGPSPYRPPPSPERGLGPSSFPGRRLAPARPWPAGAPPLAAATSATP